MGFSTSQGSGPLHVGCATHAKDAGEGSSVSPAVIMMVVQRNRFQPMVPGGARGPWSSAAAHPPGAAALAAAADVPPLVLPDAPRRAYARVSHLQLLLHTFLSNNQGSSRFSP
jgi:hypothetical protein